MRCAMMGLAVALASGVGATAVAGEPKLTLQEVLARHRDSLGHAVSRTRTLSGRCEMSAPTTGAVAGALQGTFTFASSLEGFGLDMKFPSAAYPAESFNRQGDEAEVGFVLPGRRSALGNFLSTNGVALRESLLGGVLNAAWPLTAAANGGAKLRYGGVKKRDDRLLHQITYRAEKGQNDLEISIHLEAETCRHVRTLYKRSQAQGMASSPAASSSMSDLYEELEETFGDFKELEGTTLPTSWTIRFEKRGQQTQHWKYALEVLTRSSVARE